VNEADRQQLDRVTALLADVLGPDLRGAYLFGSAVLGGLQPESDLDVLAVSERPTTAGHRGRLVDRLLEISGKRTSSGRLRRVELTIVVESEVKPPPARPRTDFQYGDWLRREFEGGNLAPWDPASPDLVTLLAMARAGQTLLGPRPDELIDPVAPAALRRAMLDGIESLLADLDDDTRNVVLTLARIWTTVATGMIRSKADAADWALGRLPEEHRAVLARARAIYIGDQQEQWDDLAPEVGPYARYVVSQIG
jgi:predicted nucleotidyltransferase